MVSSIYTAQHNGILSDIWKFTSGFYFAFATSIYILFIFLLFNNHILFGKLDFLILNIHSVKKYNFVLNISVYLVIPFMLLHYYVYLKANRYKLIVKKYKYYYNKKIFGWYFMLAILLMFTIIILKV